MSRTKLIVFVVILLLVVAVLSACAGFDLGDLVRVKTPNAIQQQTGLPTTVSLNEAELEYQAWFESVQRSGAQWRSNIERGNEIRSLLGQLTLASLDEVGPTLAGLPVLGPVLPAVTGLAGLFLGVSRLRKEKEASYNKGIEVGREVSTTPTSPAVPTSANLQS